MKSSNTESLGPHRHQESEPQLLSKDTKVEDLTRPEARSPPAYAPTLPMVSDSRMRTVTLLGHRGLKTSFAVICALP
jgi:hypothetical protein